MSETDNADQLKAILDAVAALTKQVQGQEKLYQGLKKDLDSSKTSPSKTTTEGDDNLVLAELKRMREQNEKLQQRDEERAARERKRNFNSNVTKYFSEVGVKSDVLDDLVIVAEHSGLAREDEDGNVVFTVEGFDYKGVAGAKKWAETAKAKNYLSPKGRKGSGQTGSTETEVPSSSNPKVQQKILVNPNGSLPVQTLKISPELEKQAREFFGV